MTCSPVFPSSVRRKVGTRKAMTIQRSHTGSAQDEADGARCAAADDRAARHALARHVSLQHRGRHFFRVRRRRHARLGSRGWRSGRCRRRGRRCRSRRAVDIAAVLEALKPLHLPLLLPLLPGHQPARLVHREAKDARTYTLHRARTGLAGTAGAVRRSIVAVHSGRCAGRRRDAARAWRAVLGCGDDIIPVSYTHLTLPTICSV